MCSSDLAALDRLDFIADTFLSVGAPVQHAAAQWLSRRAEIQACIRQRTRENLETLQGLPAASPVRLLDVEGGWNATLEIPRLMSEEDWTLSLLDEENVLVHPGYFFDFPREAFLVLSLLPPPDRFREGLGRILARMHA